MILSSFYYCVSEDEKHEGIIEVEDYNQVAPYTDLTEPIGKTMFEYVNNFLDPDPSKGEDLCLTIVDFYLDMVSENPELFNEKTLLLYFLMNNIAYMPASSKVVVTERLPQVDKLYDKNGNWDIEKTTLKMYSLAEFAKYYTAYDIDGAYYFERYPSPYDKLRDTKENMEYEMAVNLLCYVTLTHLARNNYRINKCKNCGKYFASFKNDPNIKYCDNISPVQPKGSKKKTCKEYGKYITQKKKNDADECSLLHNKIAGRLYQRYMRATGEEENKAREAEAQFRKESMDLKNKVRDKVIPKQQYKKWLQMMDRMTKEKS